MSSLHFPKLTMLYWLDSHKTLVLVLEITPIYVHANVTTKTISSPLVQRIPFEDVSCDSALAVDSQLILYDLVTGTETQKVPYANRGLHMRIHARICEHKCYIAFIDQQNDTIHVVKMSGQALQPLVSCKAHVPKMPAHGGFTFRHNGRVICLKGGVHENQDVILIIREPGHRQHKLIHTNEMSRAKSILPRLP